MAVGVGEEGIVDAALGEDIFLHADGEEVIEIATATLHDIAQPDSWFVVRGSRFVQTLLLQRVAHCLYVEAALPRFSTLKECGHVVDRRRGGQIEFILQANALDQAMQQLAPVTAGQRPGRR